MGETSLEDLGMSMRPELEIVLCPENSMFRIDLIGGAFFGVKFRSTLMREISGAGTLVRLIQYFETYKRAEDFIEALFGE